MTFIKRNFSFALIIAAFTIPNCLSSVPAFFFQYCTSFFAPLPLQFKDGWKPTPTPRKVKSVVPAAVKRTKIEEKIKALKGYTKSFETGVRKDTDPFKQNMETKKSIQYRLTQEMKRVKGLKFVETISITF